MKRTQLVAPCDRRHSLPYEGFCASVGTVNAFQLQREETDASPAGSSVCWVPSSFLWPFAAA